MTQYRPMKLLVDGLVFSEPGSAYASIWKGVLRELSRRHSLMVLDRGNTPKIAGATLVPFPAYLGTHTAADSALIQEVCALHQAEVFLSTGYTSPLRTPSIALVTDVFPELLDPDGDDRWRMEKRLAIHFARSLLCISDRVREDLADLYPWPKNEQVGVAKAGVDRNIFRPRALSEVEAFRVEHGIAGPYFVWMERPRALPSQRKIDTFLEAVRDSGFAKAQLVVLESGEICTLQKTPVQGSVLQADADDDARAICLSGASALILPTPGEGFGFRVDEAIDCCCPVVASHHPALEARVEQVSWVPGTWTSTSLADALGCIAGLPRLAYTQGQPTDVGTGFPALAAELERRLMALRNEHLSGQHDSFLARWSELRTIQAEVDF